MRGLTHTHTSIMARISSYAFRLPPKPAVEDLSDQREGLGPGAGASCLQAHLPASASATMGAYQYMSFLPSWTIIWSARWNALLMRATTLGTESTCASQPQHRSAAQTHPLPLPPPSSHVSACAYRVQALVWVGLESRVCVGSDLPATEVDGLEPCGNALQRRRRGEGPREVSAAGDNP